MKWLIFNNEYNMTERNRRIRNDHKTERPWLAKPERGKGSRSFGSQRSALAYVISQIEADTKLAEEGVRE